jgi:hypothetical protein
MTQTVVVTGFSAEGYELYGRQFVSTFDYFWPKDVRLVCYYETPGVIAHRGTNISMYKCDGLADFLHRHRDNYQAKGFDARGRYSFRWDAVKFCKQLFYPEHAAQTMRDGDILAWFDADVVTFRSPPNEFIDYLLGSADVCYIGRKGGHSELGFWACRLGPMTRYFLVSLADMYRTDRVFTLAEWHSAYVWDHVRREHGGSLVFGNLTPEAKAVEHAWFQCELGKYTDHLKGPRKHKGRSPERPAA